MEKLSYEEENRRLRLQLSALLGGSLDGLPPASSIPFENKMLRHLIDLHAWGNSGTMITVLEFLDYPTIKKIDDIPPADLEKELDALLDLLEKGGVYLAIGGDYPPETIYRFITDTLLFEEVNSVKVTGMSNYFDYEDFHPNRLSDVNELSAALVRCWYLGSYTQIAEQLAQVLLTPTNHVFEKKNIVAKLAALVGDSGIVEKRLRQPARLGLAIDLVQEISLRVDFKDASIQGAEGARQKACVKGRAALSVDQKKPSPWEDFSFYYSKEPGDETWRLYYFELPDFEWR
ncbi:MAG: hypothetical protein LCH51_08670 [Bacteroidetes bacterium]|nr:hypothetical protein [Bacteroidota bacterium]